MTEPDIETPDLGSAAWWTAYGERLARRRPRVGGLTVEQILDEAIALLDAEGLDGLTVRSLTGRLGTSSASLYRHVASVDELLVLVMDRVLGEVDLPDSRLPARTQLIETSLEFRRVMRSHPGVVPAMRAAPMLGPNAQRGAYSSMSGMIKAGLDPERAVAVYLALNDYVLGSVFFDTAGAGERAAEEGLFDAQLAGSRRLFENAHSDEVFRLALDAFLDGFGL